MRIDLGAGSDSETTTGAAGDAGLVLSGVTKTFSGTVAPHDGRMVDGSVYPQAEQILRPAGYISEERQTWPRSY